MKKLLLYFLPVALAAGALSFWKVADPDVFWHLESGRVMLERGRLITGNTFSSSYPDHPYQNSEWLFQVLLAWFHGLWGWAGVAAFKIAAVLTLGGVIFATVLSRVDRPLIATAGATTALAVMQHRLTERPHLISYVFLALVVLLVARGERSPRSLWVLPPLFALWGNIHAEVAFGLLYLGLAIAGGTINALVRPAPAAHAPRRLLPVALACLGATLINPLGLHLLSLPLLVIRHDRSVIEFTSSSFGLFPSFWVFLALTLLLVATTRRQRDWAEILPALVLGVLALRIQRVIPFFLVAATPLAFASAAALAERGGIWRRFRVEALCSLAAYAALLWALAFERPGLYVWGWGVHERVFPVAAADVLASEPWRGNLYNPYREGGYLIHRLHPTLGVFIDSRGGGAYPRAFVSRLLYDFRAEDLPRILDDHDIQVALFNVVEVNPRFDRTRWGVVFWDDDYCLMVRRDSPNRRLLERLEYRFYLPGFDPSAETDPGNLATLILEMERNQAARRSPSAALANAVGFLNIRRGSLVRAEEQFREATRIDAEYAPAWANLGLLLMKIGRSAEAEAALTRALGLEPGLQLARARLDEMRNARR